MFLKTYKHFLLIYFLFGLCPYFTIKPRTTKYEKLLRCVPSCISLIITVAFFTYSFVMNRTIFLMYGKINDLIAYGYLLSMIISNLSGNYQCFRYHKEYSDLMRRIYRNETFSYVISSNQSRRMRNTILRKGLLILAAYFTAVLILFLNETTMASLFVKIEIAVLQFGSSLNTLHAIMYVELVRAYLKVSGNFICNASLSYDAKQRYLNLKNFKKNYFDLWNIMQKINIYFGWSLLALLMKCFIEISYTLYYYFLVLQVGVDVTTVLRKHSECLFYIFCSIANAVVLLSRKNFRILTIQHNTDSFTILQKYPHPYWCPLLTLQF